MDKEKTEDVAQSVRTNRKFAGCVSFYFVIAGLDPAIHATRPLA
jgi:hypothetical protein